MKQKKKSNSGSTYHHILYDFSVQTMTYSSFGLSAVASLSLFSLIWLCAYFHKDCNWMLLLLLLLFVPLFKTSKCPSSLTSGISQIKCFNPFRNRKKHKNFPQVCIYSSSSSSSSSSLSSSCWSSFLKNKKRTFAFVSFRFVCLNLV